MSAASPTSPICRLACSAPAPAPAAALLAAAELKDRVAAVVSRGGRPDLAGERLAEVTAPTLLIVGGADRHVLELNRQALAAIRCEKMLKVVPNAGHLFEEPGTLEAVTELASGWFQHYLDGSPRVVPKRTAEPSRTDRQSFRPCGLPSSRSQPSKIPPFAERVR